MATWQDVRRAAGELPDTVERTSGRGAVEWRVRNKAFVWERPLRRADLEALGELVVEAWLGRAPKRVTQAFLDGHPRL